MTGWSVGGTKSTLDPCEVTPENAATAALYTYTPWVGAYGIECGTAMWGGSSLVARILRAYKASFPTETTDAGDGGADASDGEAPRPPADPDADVGPDAG